MQKKWQIIEKIGEKEKLKFPEINQVILQLLFNRGINTQEKIDEFLNPDYGANIHDPFLFIDMAKAGERVFSAIKNGEKITVHGDYDADGVCSTVIAVTVLRQLGATVETYIPHRVSEGYGLNTNTVKELAKNGTKLIVTVDCGISNKPEVELANKLGIDVIVTDHHEEPPELPPATCLINPHLSREHYPFRELAGSGVVFKFAQALLKIDTGKKAPAGFDKWLLDLVAIGTVADCVPLVAENRTLVKYGLTVLSKTKRPGLQKLLEISRLASDTMTASSISFGLAPRLNAAGRIGHANTAFELLINTDLDEAKKISLELAKTNQERQKTTEKMTNESIKQIGDVGDQKILFAIGQGWSVGVVGLVAGRLSDMFSRPVLVMGASADKIVGSGRSIPEFDITKALINSRQYLDRFGGHAAACGFTLYKENYQKFINSMSNLAAKDITKESMVKKILVDAVVELRDFKWELVDLLVALEPFGQGNPEPKFFVEDIEIVDYKKVGTTGQHVRLIVKKDGVEKKVIAFGFGNKWPANLDIGDSIDMLVEVTTNEWNGNRELQLKLVDLKVKNKNL